MENTTLYQGTEIYKIRNGNWGLIVKDTNGNYITTICVKTKNYAIELTENPKMLEYTTKKVLKELEK